MGSVININLNRYLFSVIAFLESAILLTSCDELFGPSDPMPTSFNTPPVLGEYIPPVFISQARALLWVSVFTSGNSTSVLVEYGTTTSYGISNASRLSSTTAYGGTHTSFTLTGLSPGTSYHYRFTAQNNFGTSVGTDCIFTTLNEGESGILFNPKLEYDILKDISGNIYKTIRIGTQTWMAENLRTTRLNDATPIPKVTADKEWAHLATPAYCWYDNDSSSYKMSNGALYNWHAVSSDKLCPSGWHVPTDLEWTTLIYFLGGNDAALGKLQESGTAHWRYQNPAATNSSGFTALPCGLRYTDGFTSYFNQLGHEGYWWSSTKYPATADFPLPGAWELPLIYLSYQPYPVSLKYGSYTNGLSVRCLKD